MIALDGRGYSLLVVDSDNFPIIELDAHRTMNNVSNKKEKQELTQGMVHVAAQIKIITVLRERVSRYHGITSKKQNISDAGSI